MKRARGSPGLLAIVALAGAGTMIVELAAVRVLAPWFGTSSAVWTNVIGVVLLALAIGYLLGSRLAMRPNPTRTLGWALLTAALVVACLPAAANPIASLFRPEGGTLDRASELLMWGSLTASLLLFSPAAIALGCVGPLAVECVQQRTEGHAGTAGGAVLCASTLGSLAGTFGTTHFLVPALGISLSFYIAAGTLALLGLITHWMAGGVTTAGGGTAAACALFALGPGFQPPQLGPNTRLLETAQSTYQTVRVVETGEGPTLQRQLQVNEGLDSFQSVWQPSPGLLPAGYYYNYFCLPAWWSAGAGRWRVMVLGLGAGTAWRVLEGAMPDDTTLDASGVEIDPKVVELARSHMDLAAEGPGRRTWSGWDARAALAQGAQEYDQIILDTYANQMEVPAHLCSEEFFTEVHEHLVDGGWLTINIGGFDLDDPVVEAITSTAASAFERPALLVRVPFSRNCIAYLRRGALPFTPGSPGWTIEDGPAASLLPPVELDGAWKLIRPGSGPLLTDDRNGIDALQRESLSRASLRLARLEASKPGQPKP